ncbi:uncharacterized protein Z518_02146 [Rhinocladiella mackenziei CBS 650.93]|uniref:Uncharacterized protein n=1 Tax=Rhinocladiella mackenziei CBS 650.93 TaxID=1442369 RepID=A0A0D2HAL2_9EURO|nr:uncharacterized protein Z518_02146 [Rhinocladiella mackenziei CBS 650.93]KIX07493.1 hypothetical protein Z518_02146 [Rhinocladiella mackenziei CBS 650.93]
MAAPPELSCTNLSGKFTLNKSLSDDVDSMLALQGLSWLTRKAIGLATVVLTIREYTNDGILHIDITSAASGLSTTQEDRILDWQERETKDKIFGTVNGQSRMWKTGEFQMAGPGSDEDATFLRAEKLKDGQTSKFLDDEHVQSFVTNIAGGDWSAEQNWGFEDINGERRYTRRVVCWKGDKVQRVRLVYDYKGKVEEKKDDEDLAYGSQ